MSRAIQEGYIEPQNDPFLRFSTAKYRKVARQTTRKYLSPEEIQMLENLEIPEHLEYLEKIRDMFLLSCYSGLRYSDVIALDESCLQYSKGEGYSLYYSMQHKTKTDVLVPIYLLFNRKPEQIVKKYLAKGDQTLFKGLTNQYINRCLKQLAFLAGIKRRLTFHMGRHSGVYPDKNRGHPPAGYGPQLRGPYPADPGPHQHPHHPDLREGKKGSSEESFEGSELGKG